MASDTLFDLGQGREKHRGRKPDETDLDPGIFDLAEGQRRKIDGQNLVASNEHEDFNAAIDRIIDRLAAESFRTGVPFHADDVRRIAASDPDFPEPKSDRSWGSRYGTASRLGVIRPSGGTRASAYVANHGGRTMLWIGTGKSRNGGAP